MLNINVYHTNNNEYKQSGKTSDMCCQEMNRLSENICRFMSKFIGVFSLF